MPRSASPTARSRSSPRNASAYALSESSIRDPQSSASGTVSTAIRAWASSCRLGTRRAVAKYSASSARRRSGSSVSSIPASISATARSSSEIQKNARASSRRAAGDGATRSLAKSVDRVGPTSGRCCDELCGDPLDGCACLCEHRGRAPVRCVADCRRDLVVRRGPQQRMEEAEKRLATEELGSDEAASRLLCALVPEARERGSAVELGVVAEDGHGLPK